MQGTTSSVCWEFHVGVGGSFFHSSSAASMCESISSHCMASGCEAQRRRIYPELGPAPGVFTSHYIVMIQSWERTWCRPPYPAVPSEKLAFLFTPLSALSYGYLPWISICKTAVTFAKLLNIKWGECDNCLIDYAAPQQLCLKKSCKLLFVLLHWDESKAKTQPVLSPLIFQVTPRLCVGMSGGCVFVCCVCGC